MNRYIHRMTHNETLIDRQAKIRVFSGYSNIIKFIKNNVFNIPRLISHT